VIPKLKRTVEEWDPRSDPVPVHSWILPWRDLSPEGELQPLYEIIQAKLSSVLRDWHPSDGSAFAVISPWQDVFLKQNFEALLARSILPKLHTVLRSQFVINPAQQFVDPFKWVMDWAQLIPTRVMIQLLRMEFFTKWFAALYTWLSRDPNFEEVSKWYLGWKNLMPDNLRDTPDVKQILNRGLDMLNMSIKDPRGLPGIYKLIENELKNPTVSVAPAPKPGTVEKVPRSSPPPIDFSLSFKESLQKIADLHGLEFVPNQRRGFMDGKQIFSFGRVAVYLDNKTIYASLQDASGGFSWSPISLQDLIEKAK
jgi:tuftelin-interacting protein 11